MSGDMEIHESPEMRAFDYAGRLGVLMGAMREAISDLRWHANCRTISPTRAIIVAGDLQRALDAERRADAAMTARVVQAGSPFLNRPLRTQAEVIDIREKR